MKKSNGIPFTKESASEAGKKSWRKRKATFNLSKFSAQGNAVRWANHRKKTKNRAEIA